MNKRLTSNIFCLTYGHNYFRLSQANENTPELICKCCKNYFKFEDDGSITAVTHKENENITAIIFTKKTA